MVLPSDASDRLVIWHVRSTFSQVLLLEHAFRPTTRGAPCDRGHLAWSRDPQSAKGWGIRIRTDYDLLRSEPVSFSAVIGHSQSSRRQIETRISKLFYEALVSWLFL